MIKHELNTPGEMMRRLVYVLYVGCLFLGFLFGLMGIFGMNTTALSAGGMLAFCAYVLRYIGMRWCEFSRLSASFPMGVREDVLSEEVRERFGRLIDIFRIETDWVRRHEIRCRMAKMVEEEPLLFTAFHHEIRDVHPVLYHISLSRNI